MLNTFSKEYLFFFLGDIEEGKNLRRNSTGRATRGSQSLCEDYGKDSRAGRYICTNGRNTGTGASLQRKTIRSKETCDGRETKHFTIFFSKGRAIDGSNY